MLPLRFAKLAGNRESLFASTCSAHRMHNVKQIAGVQQAAANGGKEALRGADFTALKETDDYVREQEREA